MEDHEIDLEDLDGEETEIDHEYTDEIVCPHCGYEHGDSWEAPDDGEDDCEECGKPFRFVRDITVRYSTTKVREER